MREILTLPQMLIVVADEPAVKATVDSLQRIYTIILALAIGEALKQFVADKADTPEDRKIHWDRLWALAGFIALVIPFLHGMNCYFFEIYQKATSRPRPYGLHLLIDCILFTVEGGLFFVLSRCLAKVQLRRFYWTVFILLGCDVAWGMYIVMSRIEPQILPWVCINGTCMAILFIIMLVCRKHSSTIGPIIAMMILLLRSCADYLASWHFYFPGT